MASSVMPHLPRMRTTPLCMFLISMLVVQVISKPMLFSTGQPWKRYPRQSYRQQSRQPYYSSKPAFNPREHFLDDENWMTNKKIRPYSTNKQRRPGHYSWTSKLICANVAMFAAQSFFPVVTQAGIKISDRILRGEQLYRLFTPMFLHGNWIHLFTNMYSLQNLGQTTEELFGSGRFVAMYLAGGVAGNIMSTFKSPNPSLGASGAVFGVMAGLYAYLARHEWILGNRGRAMSDSLAQTFLINCGAGLVMPMIDNWGHLGGALGGAAMAYYFGPRLFIAETPFGTRDIVDKPYLRLPNYLESIPGNVSMTIASVTKRLQPWQYLPQTKRPWARGSRINYSYRRAVTEPRSIKPDYQE